VEEGMKELEYKFIYAILSNIGTMFAHFNLVNMNKWPYLGEKELFWQKPS